MFDIGFWADKGKPGENRGRKATGSKSFGYDSPAAEDWEFFYLRLNPDSRGEINGGKYQTQTHNKYECLALSKLIEPHSHQIHTTWLEKERPKIYCIIQTHSPNNVIIRKGEGKPQLLLWFFSCLKIPGCSLWPIRQAIAYHRIMRIVDIHIGGTAVERFIECALGDVAGDPRNMVIEFAAEFHIRGDHGSGHECVFLSVCVAVCLLSRIAHKNHIGGTSLFCVVNAIDRLAF